MLSRVASRAKGRSARDTTRLDPRIQMDVVDRAPELLRWSDFSSPFPPVAMGGYKRYFVNSVPTTPEAPSYCPRLSQEPNPSSSREIPPTSPLFSVHTPEIRPLTIIHEASKESTSPCLPDNLFVQTNTHHAPLRRQRRRLLRTPSLERDFSVHARHLFASSLSGDETSSSSIDRTRSHRSAHSYSESSDSHSSAYSYLSNQSESMRSDFPYHSDFPITPSTSVESGDEGYVSVRGQLETEWIYEQKRPVSSSSFSTARSDFSDSET